MAVTSGLCDTFLADLLEGTHTANDSYHLALYLGTASTIGYQTTVYSAGTTGQVSGTNYTAGGIALQKDSSAGDRDGTGANIRLNTSSHYAGYDFGNATFSNVTLTTLSSSGFYALIYNKSRSDKAVAWAHWGVGDLASDPTAQNLIISLPSSGNLVVKLAGA